MLGLAIALIGILIRQLAIRQMKQFNLAITYTYRIEQDGIYKYIRHPAYLGSFITFVGLSLISLQLTLLYFIFVFYLSRAIDEEHLLQQNPTYFVYMQKTDMFIPWRFIYGKLCKRRGKLNK